MTGKQWPIVTDYLWGFFKKTFMMLKKILQMIIIYFKGVGSFHWFDMITPILAKNYSLVKARSLGLICVGSTNPGCFPFPKAQLHCWYSSPAPAAGALILKLSEEHRHPSAVHPKSPARRSLIWLGLQVARSGSHILLHNEAAPYVYALDLPKKKVSIALNHWHLRFIKKWKKCE